MIGERLFTIVGVRFAGELLQQEAQPRTRGGIHLHNEPILIMYGAFICGVLVMLSVVIDHYDKRNNEHVYEIFSKIFKYLGWGLFATAIVFQLMAGRA